MSKNVTKIAAGLGAASVLAVSGAALANSQTTTPGSSSTVVSSSVGHGWSGDDHGRNHHRTPVTGAVAADVIKAVHAKDSAVSVKVVFKKADGSYVALGTKAGQPVHVDVSKDLKTVTVKTGFGPGGHGGWGHRHGAPVSAATLADIKAAVKAKDAAVTIQAAHQEQNGSYHAFGTKGGQPVRVEISKDLKTISVQTGMKGRGPGGHGGPGDFRGGQPSHAPSGSTGSSSTAASTGTAA